LLNQLRGKRYAGSIRRITTINPRIVLLSRVDDEVLFVGDAVARLANSIEFLPFVYVFDAVSHVFSCVEAGSSVYRGEVDVVLVGVGTDNCIAVDSHGNGWRGFENDQHGPKYLK